MNATYDRQADGIYVYLAPDRGPIVRTDVLTSDVMVDLNAADELVGIEILRVGAIPDLAGLLAQFGVSLPEVEFTWISAGIPQLPVAR
jgi:uncharacterized protein YuzE